MRLRTGAARPRALRRLCAWATPEEGPISKSYGDEAEQGHQILAIYADEPEQVERARRILARHRAHAIEYFGSRAITDLPAQEDAPPGV